MWPSGYKSIYLDVSAGFTRAVRAQLLHGDNSNSTMGICCRPYHYNSLCNKQLLTTEAFSGFRLQVTSVTSKPQTRSTCAAERVCLHWPDTQTWQVFTSAPFEGFLSEAGGNKTHRWHRPSRCVWRSGMSTVYVSTINPKMKNEQNFIPSWVLPAELIPPTRWSWDGFSNSAYKNVPAVFCLSRRMEITSLLCLFYSNLKVHYVVFRE